MGEVVFVHGVGKQYLSEDSLARDVVPELRGGTRLAGGPVPTDDEVSVAFYGDLFRPRGTRAGQLPRYDAVDVETEEEFALLMAWWAEAARTDPDVPGPGEVDGRGLTGWAASQPMRLRAVQAALNALTGARFLRGVVDRALIGDLKQVTGYFTEASIRSEAKERLAARITPQTRVVVAHSLGSVVAYETLCDEKLGASWDVHALITLGSPLGMGAIVLDRLQPEPVGRRAAWPKPLRSWTNIADAMDIVSAVRELRPAFGSRVTDLTVHNGTHMHEASRYLTAVETGQAITAGLRGEHDAS